MADDGSQQRKPDFKTTIEDVKAVFNVVAMEAESILGRRVSRFLGVLVLFILVVSTLLALLNWYIAPSSAGQRQALVVTLAQILGGAALLSGLYFTWRTLQVNREGQITERFTKAIDQLGKTDDEGEKLLEIRLGGIYALERIAKESKEDYWPIIEVLTAYVRRYAPLTSRKQYPDLDIQAIMRVLQRRAGSYRHGEPEPLELRRTHLQRANLYGADLSGALLFGANLEDAEFRKANLSGAYLRGVRLHGARLQGAHLEGADLRGTDVTDKQLEEATGDQETLLPSYCTRPSHWK